MQKQTRFKKIAILGASRGLGRAFSLKWHGETANDQMLLVARRYPLLLQLQEETLFQQTNQSNDRQRINIHGADFSCEEGQNSTLNQLNLFSPDQIFYFAGGGPYGNFSQKEWKDHWWSLQVTFIFPMRLVHWAMKKNVQQFVLIGSAVCEDKGDLHGASYSAAKHGLLGLYRSLHLAHPDFDLRLFSPGYMDTDLLPQKSWPRHKGDLTSASEVAQVLWRWSQTESIDKHFVWRD